LRPCGSWRRNRQRAEGPDPALFIVVPGHEIPDVENIVERTDDFVLVKKNEGGIGEKIAAATDPRE